MGARDESSTVPGGRSLEPIRPIPASVSRRAVEARIGSCSVDKSFGVAKQCSPPQYDGSFVLGVLPP